MMLVHVSMAHCLVMSFNNMYMNDIVYIYKSVLSRHYSSLCRSSTAIKYVNIAWYESVTI